MIALLSEENPSQYHMRISVRQHGSVRVLFGSPDRTMLGATAWTDARPSLSFAVRLRQQAMLRKPWMRGLLRSWRCLFSALRGPGHRLRSWRAEQQQRPPWRQRTRRCLPPRRRLPNRQGASTIHTVLRKLLPSQPLIRAAWVYALSSMLWNVKLHLDIGLQGWAWQPEFLEENESMQAADSSAPAHQDFVQSAKRRSQTAWYSARSTGEMPLHAY